MRYNQKIACQLLQQERELDAYKTHAESLLTQYHQKKNHCLGQPNAKRLEQIQFINDLVTTLNAAPLIRPFRKSNIIRGAYFCILREIEKERSPTNILFCNRPSSSVLYGLLKTQLVNTIIEEQYQFLDELQQFLTSTNHGFDSEHHQRRHQKINDNLNSFVTRKTIMNAPPISP